jgi:two-component system chemotaxis response regulator CheY
MSQALVVEDSTPMREMMVQALRRVEGLVTVEAADGLDALRKISNQQFDIILTDINMPILDGLKLVKRLRSDENYRTVPVIIVTTESADEDRQRALALGANAYLTKPVKAAELTELVAQLLTPGMSQDA